MGVIHLAVLEGPGGFSKLLVVKELRAELAADEAFVAMFFEEARVAARLSHPNIVQTLEVGSQGDRHFLAMEYIEGPSLLRFARRAHRRGKLVPLSVHLYLLGETLAALEYAHSLTEHDGTPTGFVHRDVSPGNVLVTYDGHVKLVDFGIAQTSAAADATHAGTLKGKMNYMAPEQAACEAVDRRADVFSAGLLLWEAVVGRQPWEGESDGAILRRLLAGDIPRVRDALPEVDANLMAIVDRATSAEPDDRYPTALALRDDLEKYRAQLDASGARLEVAALLLQLFAEDRKRLRAVLDDRLGNHGQHGRPLTSSGPRFAAEAPVDRKLADDPARLDHKLADDPARLDRKLADNPARLDRELADDPDGPGCDEASQPVPSLAPSAIWIPPAPTGRRRGWWAAGALLFAAAAAVVALRGRGASSIAELWPGVDGAVPPVGRAPATASTTVVGLQGIAPREEHTPLDAESGAPLPGVPGAPSSKPDAAPPPSAASR
jgi:serine/threonine-protein kinase